MKRIKQILSIFLALTLILSILSMTAYAQDTQKTTQGEHTQNPIQPSPTQSSQPTPSVSPIPTDSPAPSVSPNLNDTTTPTTSPTPTQTEQGEQPIQKEAGEQQGNFEQPSKQNPQLTPTPTQTEQPNPQIAEDTQSSFNNDGMLTLAQQAQLGMAQQAQLGMAQMQANKKGRAIPSVFGQNDAQPFIIKNKTQLTELATLIKSNATYGDNTYAYATAYYKLEENIDFNGDTLAPIGDFKGFFNGDGKEITNILLTTPNHTDAFLGLFTGYNSGSITNLVVSSYYAGEGNATTPYEIVTPQQLNRLADLVNDDATNQTYGSFSYKLTADIDLAIYKDANGGKGFTPIGNGVNRFKGDFDGNAKLVKNLTINDDNNFNIGLFGIVETGSIKNLGVVNFNIAGKANLGGLAGYINNSTIKQCYTTGNIKGDGSVGGLMGMSAEGSTTENCYTNVNVTGTGAGIGGLAGKNEASKILNCYTIGSVTSKGSCVGGIVGESANNSTVENCIAYIDKINGNAGSTNRIVGINSGTLKNNYARSGIKVNGEIVENALPDRENGDNIGYGNTKLSTQFKEVFGDANPAWIYTEDKLSILAMGSTTQTKDLPNYLEVNFEGGDGTQANPYQIATPQQLKNLADLINDEFTNSDFTEKYYILTKDIDLSIYKNANGGKGWTPIGKGTNNFKGNFDGDGKAVKNLTINDEYGYFQGLFGDVMGAGIIKNLGIVDCNIKGYQCVGGLVGAIGATVENCYTTGKVSGNTFVGGLVGDNRGTLKNSYSTANVDAKKDNAGGLVGLVFGNLAIIENCYATGDVKADGFAGGLVGILNEGNIKKCFVFGEKINGTTIGTNRILGIGIGSPTLSGNYAWAGTKVNDATVSGGTATDENGADITYNGATGLSTQFSTIFGNNAVWTFTNNGLPILANGSTTYQTSALPSYVAQALSGGTGIEADPYQITTPQQLKAMADLVNGNVGGYRSAHYKLMEDIDLSIYKNANGGKGFTPIGNATTNFEGTFDGNGKVIKNLTINNKDADNQGLFGFISNATIKNLGVADCNVTGRDMAGGLVGLAEGTSTIENCYTTGSVTGDNYIGGLVGDNRGTVTNCYSTANVTAINNIAGGLIGSNRGKIENNYATGSVSGTSMLGGLVGQSSNGEIAYSYATGSVSGNNSVGGLVGYIDGGKIKNSIALGESISGYSLTNRIVGQTVNSPTLTANFAWSGMKVNGSTVTNTDDRTPNGKDILYKEGSGLEPQLNAVLDDRSGSVVWNYGDNLLSTLKNAGGTQHKNLPGYIFCAGGKGTPTDPYLIATPQHLKAMANLINGQATNSAYRELNYKLTADIDLAGYSAGMGFTPIGVVDIVVSVDRPFKGAFDGGGKVVKNLTINNPYEDNQGLFGTAENATIKNLGVVDCNVLGVNGAGGLVGYLSHSDIINSYSTGDVTTDKNYAGGLVGRSNNSDITNSYTTGDVTANTSSAGGLVGYLGYSDITNSYTTVKVTADTNYAGGLVGYSDNSDITNCYTTGDVTANTDCAGGLVGNSTNITITNSIAFGANINSPSNAHRIIGINSGVATLTNNHAYNQMRVNGSPITSPTPADIEGAHLTTNIATATSPATLNTQFSTVFSTNNDAWVFADNKLPILKNVGGKQDTDLPIHVEGLFSGSGTQVDPYQITTPQQLQYMAILVNNPITNGEFGGTNKYYELKTNIDLSIFTDAIGGKGFTPIGTLANSFKGIFNGNGYVVKNLIINNSTEDNQGLFGGVNGGSIKNLGVVDCNVSGKNQVGGLVGLCNETTIEKCYTTGYVEGENLIGGLVGNNITGNIINCYSTANVRGNDYVGGFVGQLVRNLNNNDGSITNCYTIGNVSGSTDIGGMLGYGNHGLIKNSLALNKTISATSNAGRVVGRMESDATLTDNYAYAAMQGGGNDFGKTKKDGESKSYSDLRNINDEAWVGFKGTEWKTLTSGYLPILDGFNYPQPNRKLTEVTEGMVSVDVKKDGSAQSGAVITDTKTNFKYTIDSSALVEPGVYNLEYASQTINNIDIKAKTTLNFYTLTFDTQGGSSVSSQTLYNAKTGSKPKEPTKDGYVFEDWYTSPTATTPFSFATPITSKTTLYARWNLATYDVTFDANGGTRTGGGSLNQKVEHGKNAIAPILAKEGFVFNGWDAPLTNITKNTKIKASWAPLKKFNVITNFAVYTGSGEVSAIIDANHANFLALFLNNTEVGKEHYNHSSGSTVITLKESYLKTFSDGTYNLRATFSDGYGDLPLTVKLAPAPSPSPQPTPTTTPTPTTSPTHTPQPTEAPLPTATQTAPPITYITIKASAGTGGSISPKGNVDIEKGTDYTFYITGDDGYRIAQLKVDGKTASADKNNAYTFRNVQANHTISVTFVKEGTALKTGDSTNLFLWTEVLIIALCIAGIGVVWRLAKGKQ